MIICPNCKAEIEENSNYCDQCGQSLVYCSSCGRVGTGRRCTYCGGLMVSADELIEQRKGKPKYHTVGEVSQTFATGGVTANGTPKAGGPEGIPTLTLYNPSLDIRIIGVNGAIIGRKQGPYQQLFDGNMYISGVHAQLLYKPDSGWCVIDKHSSNGTKLNQRDLLPDIPMSVKTGDIVSLANINLQVSVN